MAEEAGYKVVKVHVNEGRIPFSNKLKKIPLLRVIVSKLEKIIGDLFPSKNPSSR